MASLSADQLPNLNNIISKMIHALHNLEFGKPGETENIWCTFVVVDGGLANECCSSSHSLRRIPVGTLVVWQDKAAVLYKPTESASADTNTAVFYKFDTTSTSAVLLLI